VVDFHALRHTFITLLARSGVAPALAKSRARHSTILMLVNLGKSELARQVQYLKAENEILRAKLPKRVSGAVMDDLVTTR